METPRTITAVHPICNKSHTHTQRWRRIKKMLSLCVRISPMEALTTSMESHEGEGDDEGVGRTHQRHMCNKIRSYKWEKFDEHRGRRRERNKAPRARGGEGRGGQGWSQVRRMEMPRKRERRNKKKKIKKMEERKPRRNDGQWSGASPASTFSADALALFFRGD